MTNNELANLGELIADVMKYYRQDVSKFTLDLWLDACKDFDFEQVVKALNAHAKDPERGVFAPKVADLVRVLQGTNTDRSLLAWGKVLSAMSAVGAYQDVIFDDPAIHAALTDVGGWQKVCRGETDQLSYLQHQFCAAHKAYTAKGKFEYPRLLSGDRSPDSEYSRRGLPVPKPAIVGDAKLAAKVMLGGGTGGPRISFQGLQELTRKALEAA